MRIYDGDYAYEVERVVDPQTQLTSTWRFNVYRVRPADELLSSGNAASKEAAEEAGRQALAETLKTERNRTRNQTVA